MKVYLAGPDVFLPNAAEIATRKKEICRRYELIGLFPLDNEIATTGKNRGALAREIYRGNTRMMDEADAIIANLTPFRSPSADVGTVFELGYMAARGKICFGYSNDLRGYHTRIEATAGLKRDVATGRPRDTAGFFIEDFELPDNLMIVETLAQAGHALIIPDSEPEDLWHDLSTFEICARKLNNLIRRKPPATSYGRG